MLYLISLGLGEKGISLRGLETARKCDTIYLEEYTSVGWGKEEIEKAVGKRIIGAGRDFVESEKIIDEAETKDVCLLVYGDALSATTHASLINDAVKRKVKYEVVHGASVLSAVGETGLSLYKFGAVGSIPFERKNVKSAYDILVGNDKAGLHTLFLLDLDPKNGKFVDINEGVEYLIKNGMGKERMIIACSRLGLDKQRIISGKAGEMMKIKMNAPCCLIVAGRMNFMEEEMIERFKTK